LKNLGSIYPIFIFSIEIHGFLKIEYKNIVEEVRGSNQVKQQAKIANAAKNKAAGGKIS
jgi:hypothetical protein